MDSRFLIKLGDREYATYQGVLAEAHERGLQSIETSLVQIPGPDNDHVAIARAVVTMKDGTRFEEWGDSSPRNTNARIATALCRMALTRAKGRALRDAVNVGQTLLEELPDTTDDAPIESSRDGRAKPAPTAGRKGGQATAPEAEGALMLSDGKILAREKLLAGWDRTTADAIAVGIIPPVLDLDRARPADIYEAAMDLARQVTERRKEGGAQA
jgi:hypothetical protein